MSSSSSSSLPRRTITVPFYHFVTTSVVAPLTDRVVAVHKTFHLFSQIARVINGVGLSDDHRSAATQSRAARRQEQFDVKFEPLEAVLDPSPRRLTFTEQCDLPNLLRHIYEQSRARPPPLNDESHPLHSIISTLPLLVIIEYDRSLQFANPYDDVFDRVFPYMKVVFIDSVLAGRNGVLEQALRGVRPDYDVEDVVDQQLGCHLKTESERIRKVKKRFWTLESARMVPAIANPFLSIDKLRNYPEVDWTSIDPDLMNEYATVNADVMREYAKVKNTRVFPKAGAAMNDATEQHNHLVYQNIQAALRQRANELRARASVVQTMNAYIVTGPENEQALDEIADWIDVFCGAGSAEVRQEVATTINKYAGVASKSTDSRTPGPLLMDKYIRKYLWKDPGEKDSDSDEEEESNRRRSAASSAVSNDEQSNKRSRATQ